jgi:hypothetical protein
MSGWDPHCDLVRLLAALSNELVASAEPEVQSACLRDDDSIEAAAKDVRKLIGAFIDNPDEPEPGVRPFETADGLVHWVRPH